MISFYAWNEQVETQTRLQEERESPKNSEKITYLNLTAIAWFSYIRRSAEFFV